MADSFDKDSLLRIDMQAMLHAIFTKTINEEIALRIQHPANETSFIITNLDAPTIGGQVSHVIAEGTRTLFFKPRRNATMQFSFIDGETDTNFITVESGQGFVIDMSRIHATTLYIEQNKINNTIEIMEST